MAMQLKYRKTKQTKKYEQKIVLINYTSTCLQLVQKQTELKSKCNGDKTTLIITIKHMF